MNYTLMHRQIPVAALNLDEKTGWIRKVNTLFAPEHLPLGISAKKGAVDRKALNEWWGDRCIPDYRTGLREALAALGVDNPRILQIRAYGLSLSDHYWIRPEGSPLSWDDVNFFDHTFSTDIGDVLFDPAKVPENVNWLSPDSTCDGNLRKRWITRERRRILLKGGSYAYCQQPMGEVIATQILAKMNIPHIPYRLVWEQGRPYSACENFLTSRVELVPAWRIYLTKKKPNDLSVYQHFIHCADSLGIPDVVPFLNRMMAFDYILANEDRHFNNFGALRSSETLEWIGLAPIYDNGTALGYDKTASEILRGEKVTCKPFKKHYEEQIKLISSFEGFSVDGLDNIREDLLDFFSEENVLALVGEDRARAIAGTVQKRAEHIKKLAQAGRAPAGENISTKDDVKKNVAKSYE